MNVREVLKRLLQLSNVLSLSGEKGRITLSLEANLVKLHFDGCRCQ